jgi:transcriptional regulator with XRE-family HTH domain
MRQALRKQIGTFLRNARIKQGFTLDEIIVDLQDDYKVKCSKSNLARIERNEIPCRNDILAALCLIMSIDVNTVLYK